MRVLLLMLFVSAALPLFPQDADFGQNFVTPLNLNPAFAGSAGCARAGVVYHNHWPGISLTNGALEHATVLSYDQNIKNLNAAAGFTVSYERAGTAGLKTIRTGVTLARHFSIGRFNLTPAAEVSYLHKDINEDLVGVQPELVENVKAIDLSGGLLFHGERFFAGFSVFHLNRPDGSLINGAEYFIQPRHSLHLGYVFGDLEENSRFNIAPDVIYKRQDFYNSWTVGLNFSRKWFKWCVKTRTDNNLIFGLGASTGRFRLNYTYELFLSHLTLEAAGSHEVGLRVNLGCKNVPESFRSLKLINF